jgi:hypothetical protein
MSRRWKIQSTVTNNNILMALTHVTAVSPDLLISRTPISTKSIIMPLSGVDSSASAIRLAEENATLPQGNGAAHFEHMEVEPFMRQAALEGRLWDIVVLGIAKAHGLALQYRKYYNTEAPRT